MSLIPHTRRGMLWRFLVAAVLVIGASAATTAVAGLLQFKQLATDLSVTPALPHAQITLPAPGAPQTLLVIGSDHRAGTPFSSANTDTMLLVRIDDSSSTINVLSIPRDLEVQIPGFGTAKLNQAYADGGPNLLITTIRDNVFPDFHVSHIIDVNFSGFSDLVNAIGCVYAAVDQRYYNLSTGIGTANDFSSIDIKPGYQKLCGNSQVTGALAFVRFRHTDSDIVRNARQQDFIRWAKEQYSADQLLANRDKLVRIFALHAETDHSLHTTDGLINLFDLVINADGHTIKSIPFPAQLQNCVANAPCYVTAISSEAETQAYAAFLHPTTAVAASTKTHPNVKVHHAAAVAGLVADVAGGHSQAAALSRAGMPIYFPKLIVADGEYCLSITANCDSGLEPETAYTGDYPRAYTIHDRQGKPYAAYYMTLAINPTLGQFFGVQGTTWRNPPLLASPSETKVVDGKKLELFAAGGKLMTVAWRTPGAVYWIENTLTGGIPNAQMVAMAASLTPAGAGRP